MTHPDYCPSCAKKKPCECIPTASAPRAGMNPPNNPLRAKLHPIPGSGDPVEIVSVVSLQGGRPALVEVNGQTIAVSPSRLSSFWEG